MENHTKLGVLKTRSEFLHVRSGKHKAFKNLVIQANANPSSGAIRVGFTATKKIGNAVVRNKCKRKLRALAKEVLVLYAKENSDYVLIARKATFERNISLLKSDLINALKEIKHIKQGL